MLVKMPRLHECQQGIVDSPARFKIVGCGRRFGKTMLAVTLALMTAISGGSVWWIGPTGREALIGWRAMVPMAKKVPGTKVLAGIRTITFPSGGWIAVLSAESQTLRGEGLDRVIIDEAAYVLNLRERWQEDIRPALSDKQGDGVMISTFDGRRNFFFEAYERGLSDEWPSWQSWALSTYKNPYIPRAELEESRRELPPWVFGQEYMAIPAVFAGKVYKTFTPECEAVFDDVDPGRYGEWWGGIDFGFRNPTAVSVGGIDRDDRLDIVDGLYAREMTNPDLIDAMRRLQEQYPVQTWFADPADPGTIQELRAAGLPVSPAPRTKGGLERSSVKEGIVKVETRLVAGRLRIARHLTDHVREMDTYRYAGEREGSEAKEAPLKVDDHAPDSIRYLVAGVDHLRGRNPSIMVAA